MGNPVVYFEIMGKDARKLRAFYSEAFGWEIAPRIEGANIVDYTLVHTNSPAGIPGGIGEAPAEYDGHVTLYIDVPDVGRALETVEKLGATRMMGPEQVPGGPIIGLFRDPEGRTVGVMHRPADT